MKNGITSEYANKHSDPFCRIKHLQLSVVGDVLGDVTISHQTTTLSHGSVLLTRVLGESPLLRHHNLLATRELHGSTTQSLHSHLLLIVLRTNRNQRLTDSHTSHQTVGLSESVTHTGLQSISTGARKHLVDTSHMEGVSTHSHVERVLASVLHQVLVGSNTSSLQSLRRQLLTLIGQKVSHEGISIDASGLVTDIEDANLGIYLLSRRRRTTGHSTAEAGLDVRLVLTVTIATSRTTAHLNSFSKGFFVEWRRPILGS